MGNFTFHLYHLLPLFTIQVSSLTYKSHAKWKMLRGICSAIYELLVHRCEKCVEIKGDYVEKYQSCFISVTLKSWSGQKLLDPTTYVHLIPHLPSSHFLLFPTVASFKLLTCRSFLYHIPLFPHLVHITALMMEPASSHICSRVPFYQTIASYHRKL